MEMESSIHSNPSQRNETVHPLAAAKASPSAVHATPPLQRSALASGGSPQTPPRSSSIGIRRAPSTPLLPRVNIGNAGLHQLSERSQSVGRPRSSSSPPPHSFTAPLSTSVGHRTGNRFMPSLREGASRAIAASLQIPHSSSTIPIRRRGVTTSEVSDLRLERLARLSPPNDTTHDHEPSVFELLDVVSQWAPKCQRLTCYD